MTTATIITSPSRFQLLTFYIGGFMGPFGTMIVIPMFPELRTEFATTSETISWAFSAYMLPMAVVLIVSGTIGERYGRRIVLRWSYGLYALASLAAVAAPSLAVFLAARAAQGMANAFFTPLLIAGLAEITDEASLGRRVGVYTSFQAFGSGLAPFLGGLAAHYDWRYAFAGAGAVAAVLAVFAPPGTKSTATERPPLSSLASPRFFALGVAVMAAAAGPLGIGVLVGFKARDVLGMTSTQAGLVLAFGSLASVPFGPQFGRLVDRFGLRRCGFVSLAIMLPLVVLVGLSNSRAGLTAAYVASAILFGLFVVVFQKASATLFPHNRGGAVSALMSFRFVGHAIGPLIWVPVFTAAAGAAFAGSAALGLVAVAGLALSLPSASAVSPEQRTSSQAQPAEREP